jgi:hypothetical protein
MHNAPLSLSIGTGVVFVTLDRHVIDPALNILTNSHLTTVLMLTVTMTGDSTRMTVT